ncbi:MAG: hypothetical protein DRP89_08810, partial [Candidatus Neomarinimicrobiota bacterium]
MSINNRRLSILFNVHHLYYLPQFLPVAKAMEKDGSFDIWYSAYIDKKRMDYGLIKKIIREYNGQFIDAESEVERSRKILDRNFDVTFFGKSSHAEKYCSKDTLAVLLYHGIGVKSCYYTDYNPRIDVRYVESKYRLNRLEKKNINTELIVTGFPKLDPLFEDSDYRSILKELSIDTSKPIVLYAPTFYPSSIEVFGERIAELTEDFNLIVKLHHFSWILKKYRHQRELFLKLSESYSHVKLLPVEEFNIIPFFKISDVLLSEASSTVFEYLATGKPSIVCNFYHLRRKHKVFYKKFQKSRMDTEIIRHLDFSYRLEQTKNLAGIVKKA